MKKVAAVVLYGDNEHKCTHICIQYIQYIHILHTYTYKHVHTYTYRSYKKLFNYVVDTAKSDENVAAVRLYVDNDNKKAQSVYKSMGMTSHYTIYETVCK